MSRGKSPIVNPTTQLGKKKKPNEKTAADPEKVGLT